jgi:hypothetical protein
MGGEVAEIPGPEVTLKQIIKTTIEKIKSNLKRKG